MPAMMEDPSNGVEPTRKMHAMTEERSNGVELTQSNGVETTHKMHVMTEERSHGVEDTQSNGVKAAQSNGVEAAQSNGVKATQSNGVEPTRKIQAMTEEKTNGTDFSRNIPTRNTSVWNSVSPWLPPRNADCDYWWQKTGPQLAIMLSEAGYSIKEQYEGMLLHYHLVVPRLGPCPSGPSIFKGIEDIPVAYSWKWNAADAAGVPDVRYTIKATGPSPGTLNRAATNELLHQLEPVIPSLDLTWFHHFVKVLYDDTGSSATSTTLLAFEFLKQGLAVKSYFITKNPGQSSTSELELWEKAVRGVATENTSLDKLLHFMKKDTEGSQLRPWLLATDCVKPSKSRIKLYMRTPSTSFDSVRTIMTLGGTIQGPQVDQALEALYELVKLVLGLDKDFPSSAELPPSKAHSAATFDNHVDRHVAREAGVSGYGYYFDVAPRASMPDVKFYLPLRLFAKDDLQVAEGLTRWMESHGRGQYTGNYMRILDGFAAHRSLDAGAGIQPYLACMMQGSSLSITSYVVHEFNRS